MALGQRPLVVCRGQKNNLALSCTADTVTESKGRNQLRDYMRRPTAISRRPNWRRRVQHQRPMNDCSSLDKHTHSTHQHSITSYYWLIARLFSGTQITYFSIPTSFVGRITQNRIGPQFVLQPFKLVSNSWLHK